MTYVNCLLRTQVTYQAYTTMTYVTCLLRTQVTYQAYTTMTYVICLLKFHKGHLPSIHNSDLCDLLIQGSSRSSTKHIPQWPMWLAYWRISKVNYQAYTTMTYVTCLLKFHKGHLPSIYHNDLCDLHTQDPGYLPSIYHNDLCDLCIEIKPRSSTKQNPQWPMWLAYWSFTKVIYQAYTTMTYVTCLLKDHQGHLPSIYHNDLCDLLIEVSPRSSTKHIPQWPMWLAYSGPRLPTKHIPQWPMWLAYSGPRLPTKHIPQWPMWLALY